MSLPPALMQRLAQRGLVQIDKAEKKSKVRATADKEEVIAEDYDELDTTEYQSPPQYDEEKSSVGKRNTDDNFWLERMKARIGASDSSVGYKSCPNKYNIWHKCSLYCVNRWADAPIEPSASYMRRFKRLIKKYPLPKGWTSTFDPGCRCYYFLSASDKVVSWLPPTHPKSQVSKCAAAYRRQMEESTGKYSDSESEDDYDVVKGASGSKDESELGKLKENHDVLRDLRALHVSKSTSSTIPRKQKSRDLERTISRQRRERERQRELGRRTESLVKNLNGD